MGRLDDRARLRLQLWLDLSDTITQETLASAIGQHQSYISRYLRNPSGRLPLDHLEALARVFGHTIGDLLDSPADPQEAAILEIARGLRPSTRAKWLAAFQETLEIVRRRPPKQKRRHRGAV
jgi:transcriptional regulator with XRE-family HTH domain